MRPDTPQLYEYITVENITGPVKNFILIAPWTQFYDLKGRKAGSNTALRKGVYVVRSGGKGRKVLAK